VNVYNGKDKESLNTLRYRRYCEKLATNTSQVEPRTLPPTSAAASFTVIECFFKYVNGKVLTVISNQSYGVGKKGDAGFSPTMTDSPPAPDDLLKIIRCNCLTKCQNARCSCIKHGLKRSAACGNYHGSACSNASGYVMDKGSGGEDS